MCSRTTCPTCHKPDWSGCGAHAEQVLRDVPKEERCRCREEGRRPRPRGFAEALSSFLGRRY